MRAALLVGAGFSNNWNAPLASGVMDSVLGLIGGDDHLRQTIQRIGSFEDALDVVQTETAHGADKKHLETLQGAILKTFSEINDGLVQRGGIEFPPNQARFSVRNFLARFHSIFSLNQDLLLELYYDPLLHRDHEQWNSLDYPGMQPPPNFFNGMPPYEKVGHIWKPRAERAVNNGAQPIFKLHGSANWRDQNGAIMIVGGNKEKQIKEKEILSWYYEEFYKTLRSGVRLMTIGYGFRDSHINRAIVENAGAIELFVVDLNGRDVLNPQQPNKIKVPNALEDVKYIGGSKCRLDNTFAGNTYEIQQFEKFFE